MNDLKDEQTVKIHEIFEHAVDSGILKKVVFSVSADKSIIRAESSLYKKNDRIFLEVTSCTADNKAIRRNYIKSQAADKLTDMAKNSFKRTNIITSCGECIIMVSKKGKITVINKIKKSESFAFSLDIPEHNKKKNYILDNEDSADFLFGLGISDRQGRILDRKTAKYRQINKFLEIADSIYRELPESGRLTVCDLCCGKSYLTFALYHYLTKIKGRETLMYGIDLKSDVICYCSALAEQLKYDGMKFITGDISTFSLCNDADLVVSLHACDIATDIVLINAVRLKAKVILSTPCCHHEINRQLENKELDFVLRHSILRQKVADAVTDSLRVLALEANGYSATAFELIDPEETPKNIIIKAVRKSNPSEAVMKKSVEEFKSAVRYLGVSPYIAKIVK